MALSFPPELAHYHFPHFNQPLSAYRKMHSCETALCKTLNDIYRSSHNVKCTLLVGLSLNLSAAFDTIDHNILLNRLCTRFGITGSPLTWLTSYLSSRTQCVCIGNVSSAVTDCYCAWSCLPFTSHQSLTLSYSMVCHYNRMPATHSYIFCLFCEWCCRSTLV